MSRVKILDKVFNIHNLSLIIVCLMMTNFVIFGVSISLYVIDKNPCPWFAYPHEYGIASTFLYCSFLLSIVFFIIENKNKKRINQIKVNDYLSKTNREWNNEMAFATKNIKKIFFLFKNNLTKEYLRKNFFKKGSGDRDFIKILYLSELDFIFFRIISIKVEYHNDIS